MLPNMFAIATRRCEIPEKHVGVDNLVFDPENGFLSTYFLNFDTVHEVSEIIPELKELIGVDLR
jgi:hypothetical protein